MIDLSIGEPKKKFKYLKTKFIKKNIKDLNKYPITSGNELFLKSINKWILKRNKITNKDFKKYIIPSTGNKEAIFSIAFLLSYLKKKRNIVILPDPYYKNYLSSEFFLGKKSYFLNSNTKSSFMADFKRIKKCVLKRTLLIYICSPNNPSGYILDKSDWELIYIKSKKYNFHIVSDECYSEIYFKKPLSSIKFFFEKNFYNFFAINSLSKTSSVPGLRSGFIFSSPENIKHIRELNIFSGNSLSDFNQNISSKLWVDFKRTKKIRNRYRRIISKCYKIISSSINLSKPQGGFYLWFNIKETGLSSYEFCKVLKKNIKLVCIHQISLVRN